MKRVSFGGGHGNPSATKDASPTEKKGLSPNHHLQVRALSGGPPTAAQGSSRASQAKDKLVQLPISLVSPKDHSQYFP